MPGSAPTTTTTIASLLLVVVVVVGSLKICNETRRRCSIGLGPRGELQMLSFGRETLGGSYRLCSRRCRETVEPLGTRWWPTLESRPPFAGKRTPIIISTLHTAAAASAAAAAATAAQYADPLRIPNPSCRMLPGRNDALTVDLIVHLNCLLFPSRKLLLLLLLAVILMAMMIRGTAFQHGRLDSISDKFVCLSISKTPALLLLLLLSAFSSWWCRWI